LTTVTYGARSAPYLATRRLNQLAGDERSRFPKASKAVKDFYVDDIITGCDTYEDIQELKQQLIDMLGSARFKLHKWGSNKTKLLSDIPSEQHEQQKWFKNEEVGFI
jgi:hypothetical protein